MDMISGLFSNFGGLIAAAVAIIAAVIGSFAFGKSKGKTQEKAKADVAASEVESQKVAAAAKKQAESSRAASDVKNENQSITDADARERLHQSPYNKP